PGEVPVVSAFGSPALATGGSGDILSGITGALLVGAKTRHEIYARAQLAVALHGMAAERWERLHGDRGLLPSELTDLLPDVISEVVSGCIVILSVGSSPRPGGCQNDTRRGRGATSGRRGGSVATCPQSGIVLDFLAILCHGPAPRGDCSTWHAP